MSVILTIRTKFCLAISSSPPQHLWSTRNALRQVCSGYTEISVYHRSGPKLLGVGGHFGFASRSREPFFQAQRPKNSTNLTGFEVLVGSFQVTFDHENMFIRPYDMIVLPLVKLLLTFKVSLSESHRDMCGLKSQQGRFRSLFGSNRIKTPLSSTLFQLMIGTCTLQIGTNLTGFGLK